MARADRRWLKRRSVHHGRCTDTGLTLGPMIHEFEWPLDDWDRLASGTIAGHIIECGAQCTGGNCQVDWKSIPELWDIGYPIVEARQDGTFSVTKHEGTGGRITVAGIKEQLMYEMGEPQRYISNCIADFTTVRLEQAGNDVVRVSASRRTADGLLQSLDQLFGGLQSGRLADLFVA